MKSASLTSDNKSLVAKRVPAASFVGRLRFLVRYRYSILGAILIAVLLPAGLTEALVVDFPTQIGAREMTVLGTYGAVILGFLALRRLALFPGVWSLSFVLPSFAFGYLVTVLLFFFGRVDYSRLQFAVSFVLAVGWFYFVLMLERRVHKPRLFLLPFGRATRLAEMPEANWFVAPSGLQLDLPFGERESGATHRGAGTIEWAASGPPAAVPSGVDGVVADLRAEIPASWEGFLANCALNGIPVFNAKQLKESLLGRVEIEHLSENTLGSLIPSSIYHRVKRAADLILALLLAPLLLVLGLAAAAAIKIDDGGPILFRQRRVGYRGQVFTMLKLRTMRPGSEAGELFTLDGDDRVTRVGRILRRFRIDEIPQAINIIRGEMSWIGPRPESEPLSRWYESKIPFYLYRHIVRPGISGWAAVNQGNVAQLRAATDKLQYDFFYIKNFSPWLDLLITFRTLAILVTGFGSR